VSTVRRIIDCSIRWVSLIVVSECQRGSDRRGVISKSRERTGAGD
jgi:hypothetical protein